MRNLLLSGVTALATLVGSAAGQASPFSISASVGGAPTGVSYETFDSLRLGSSLSQTLASGVTVVTTGTAAAVTGSVAGLYAAPYLSGSNGTLFGQGNGQDTTTYLTSGSTTALDNSAVTLLLPGLQRYFGLLWGSVDSGNTLSFYDGSTLIGTITGTDVLATATGDQGVNGTLYVNVNSALGFDRVVANYGSYAFEFDNLAFNPQPVPEPASLALFAGALFGLGVLRRRTA